MLIDKKNVYESICIKSVVLYDGKTLTIGKEKKTQMLNVKVEQGRKTTRYVTI